MCISLRFWPQKRVFGPVFGVPVLVIFRQGSCISLLDLVDCNKLIFGTFYFGQFLMKSVCISLRFWPQKRLFGAVFGVPVLVIFRQDPGIVTTTLGRLQ